MGAGWAWYVVTGMGGLGEGRVVQAYKIKGSLCHRLEVVSFQSQSHYSIRMCGLVRARRKLAQWARMHWSSCVSY